MTWEDSARARLPDFLDDNGDLAPPWERYPEYERGTIGWRMGAGEDWMGLWSVFLDQLGDAPEVCAAYLRRHPPAPISWADVVRDVLSPAEADALGGAPISPPDRERLVGEGLIASDASYPIWLSRQQHITWPWTHSESPEHAARYRMRELWFWSRQIDAETRQPGWTAPETPPAWAACADPLQTRTVLDPDLSKGLLTLARMLAAGDVVPPWNLNLAVSSFADSFEPDMGYADAYRLWVMSAFDDTEHRNRAIGPVPAEWQQWMENDCAVE